MTKPLKSEQKKPRRSNVETQATDNRQVPRKDKRKSTKKRKKMRALSEIQSTLPITGNLERPVENHEPTPVENQEPTPVGNQEPTPVENQEPTPVENQERTPVENQEPTPVENQEPTPVENEEHSSISKPIRFPELHIKTSDPIPRYARCGILIPAPTCVLPTPVIVEPPEPTFPVYPPTELQSQMDEHFSKHPVSEMSPMAAVEFFFTGTSTSNPALAAFELAGPFKAEHLQFRF